jgi:hypothetical protein
MLIIGQNEYGERYVFLVLSFFGVFSLVEKAFYVLDLKGLG